MKSKVYGITLRASDKENLLNKIGRLADTLELKRYVSAKDLTAIKLHFGESGCTAFIRPVLVRPIVDKVSELGGLPFLTDANCLYNGMRSNAVQHIRNAVENGFAYSVLGAPIVIADGLKGKSCVEVPVDLKLIKTAYIGADIVDADALISVAHFKLHELAGIGGAIKNVGMGGASRRGKMAQHADVKPKIKAKKCVACGACIEHCIHEAIELMDVDGEDKAVIDSEKCVGCAECIRVCLEGAAQVVWDKSIPNFLTRMVEYAAAALKDKEGKAVYFNFLTDITPACDCHPSSDSPLVRDIGILASDDPIAIDQASADLMNQEPTLSGNCLENELAAGQDKVKGVYPYIEWEMQLEYGQSIGLGSRDYNLEWLPEK